MAETVIPGDTSRPPEQISLPAPQPKAEPEVVAAPAPDAMTELESFAARADHVPRSRFTLAYAALALLGGFAVMISAIALANTDFVRSGGGAWSSFKPAGDGIDKARSIAEYVAPRYRTNEGQQLVIAGPTDGTAVADAQNLPVALIAVAKPGTSQNQPDFEPFVESKDSVSYILCGQGPKCAISSGQPSEERERLLRRETLELALYTFKYMDGVKSVVAFLPPKTGEDPTWAMYYRRSDLGAQLDQPIAKTLTEPVPKPTEIKSGSAADIVESLTGAHRYRYAYQQLQNNTVALVLSPPDA